MDHASEREAVLESVRQDGWNLETSPVWAKADREVVLAAVQQDGLALKYAAPELRAEREVAVQAMRQSGWALRCVSRELRADKDLVLEAVRNDGFGLKYAAAELQTDEEVALEAVRNDGKAMQFVAADVRNSQSLALAGKNAIAGRRAPAPVYAVTKVIRSPDGGIQVSATPVFDGTKLQTFPLHESATLGDLARALVDLYPNKECKLVHVMLPGQKAGISTLDAIKPLAPLISA